MTNTAERLCYIFLLFVVLCIGIARYKRLSLPFRILTWTVFAVFLTELTSYYFVTKYRFNGPVLQVLCIEEYVLYSTVYYYLFKNKAIKRFILLSIILMVIFFIVNATYFQPFLHKFPTNINTPALVLFTAFSLLLFREMLDYPIKIDMVKQSIFWFNSAILFYATTIFFMLSLSNYLSERPEDRIVSDIWWLIDYLFQILISIALLTHNSKQTK
jgi:hypothetical protein